MLSGTISDTASNTATSNYTDQLDWALNVATLSSLPLITGVTSGFAGTATLQTPCFPGSANNCGPYGTPFAPFGLTDASNSLNRAFSNPQLPDGIGCVTTAVGDSCTGLFTLGPVAQTAQGFADYGISAAVGGTASITSARYFVTETSRVVPEPATIGFLIPGAALLAGLIRRARKLAPPSQ